MNLPESFYFRLGDVIAEPGAISARILILRQLLESIYKEASSTSQMSFNGMFARMQYVNESRQLSSGLVAQSNKLRILGNQVAHEEAKGLTEGIFASCVLAISSLIEAFYNEAVPAGIAAWLTEHKAKEFSTFRDSKKSSFAAVIDSWEIQRDDRGETGLKISAIDEYGQQCSILLNNDFKTGNEGRSYHLLGRSLWKHATLHCQNISQSSASDSFYISNPQTLLVLEPDFLIDASSLAECFSNSKSNPEFFIIKRLFRSASSDKMLLGQIVNNIFDELVFEPDASFNDLFRRSLAANPISMVGLGKESAMDIYKTAEQRHFPQLQSFVHKLGDPQIILEPSFICPLYGLQGRLDLLYQKDGKSSIVELKSGAAPKVKTWKSQEMQVVAYNMIIRSCFGASNLGISSIFYSSTAENSERFVENFIANEQDLMMCRNRIVGIMHQLSQKPKVFFDWLIQHMGEDDNPIQRQLLIDFKTFTAQLTDYEYEWFLQQVSRIIKEIWYVKTGATGYERESVYGHNALWQESRHSKLASYKIITDLTISTNDSNLIRLGRARNDGIDDFRVGDIIVLYRQNTPVQQQQLYRGSIIQLDQDQLQISIRGGIKNKQNLGGEEQWCIEHDVLESSLYTPLSSIVAFLSSDSDKRSCWLGLREAKHPPHETSDEYIVSINLDMQAAEDYHIVQGPPGTGKTSGLLAKYISRLYHHSDKRLLILSFTNRAVDEICSCLCREAIPFIRTGSSQSIDDELLNCLIKDKTFNQIDEIIRGNRIWLATVQSCSSWIYDMLQIISFDELIVDEASQIIELGILGIISKVGKTILIGDQNQLPPITIQAPELYRFEHPSLKGLHYSYYSQSLMERLYRLCKSKGWDSSLSMLSYHYRMHEDIADLINDYYEGKLISGTDRQKEDLARSDSLLAQHRLIWIDCPPTTQIHYDPLQAQAIHRVIQILIQSGEITNPTTEVGIVSPYRSMIHCLASELPQSLHGITIDTVERFQGSERKVMLISLPLRTAFDLHTMQSLSVDGFIDRKLNVAVSRAQERLIMFGNRELCLGSAHYRNLIDKIQSKGICIPLLEIIK